MKNSDKLAWKIEQLLDEIATLKSLNMKLESDNSVLRDMVRGFEKNKVNVEAIGIAASLIKLLAEGKR